MDRRKFIATSIPGLIALAGCRGKQVGEVVREDKKDMVGSTAAGAETFKPIVDQAVGNLLARQNVVTQATSPAPGSKRICFVGLENASSEEIGDFKAQIVEIIDNKINASGVFQQVSMRYTEAGMRKLRLRPDDLFLPENQQNFKNTMAQAGNPFDYLLFAKITSGTTRNNDASQKDYMLTLELIDIVTGQPDKESATIRKAYSKRRI